MSVFRVNSRKTSGFILFVVLTIVLAMAILIFALSSHKSGAIEQLAKTIDQNRLVILAQSGNNEVLALIKHDVNNLDSPTIFAQFRSIFKDVPGALSGTKKYQIFPYLQVQAMNILPPIPRGSPMMPDIALRSLARLIW